jgi:AcrR family transcriptional regulator
MSAAATLAPPASTRAIILDAAERRFAGAGYSGTSMRDIAADVGLKNQASLYHYYRGKQDLYEAVLRRAIDALVPLWEDGGRALNAAGTTAQRTGAVASTLDRVLGFLADHPDVARLIERAGLEDDRDVRDAVARMLRPLFAAGVRVLEDAGGPWQPSELPHLAAGLYHLVFGYFANAQLLQTLMREDPRSPAMLARQRQFLTLAIARLLGGDAAPGGPAARTPHERTDA